MVKSLPTASLGTQDRLLEAAGEVFAEAGFRNATVRDICARAGVNIAAVNYHFRDKDGLYAAVLRSAHDAAARIHPFEGAGERGSRPEDRLRSFVATFMRRLFDEGRPAWQAKLMSREMIEPTGALDEVIERSVRPHFDLVCAIVRELLGPRASEDQVRLSAASIVGQCLLYRHCRPVVQKLMPEDTYSAARAAERAAHVAEFSLAALAGLRARLESGSSAA